MQRIRLTDDNGDVVVIPCHNNSETLLGVFTVNASGKKVKFSPGNLFWNGSEFKFEKHQYDYPTSWNPNHVGHFYWDKHAATTRAERYGIDGTESISDVFFAADDGAVDGFTVLSRDEWQYLIDNAMAKNSSGGNIFNIDGKRCVVLKPDGFWGTVDDNYTKEAWKQDEILFDLVALPFAGYRNGSSFFNAGSGCYCWSSVPDGSSLAYSARFGSDLAITNNFYRNFGYSVRLVSVQ